MHYFTNLNRFYLCQNTSVWISEGDTVFILTVCMLLCSVLVRGTHNSGYIIVIVFVLILYLTWVFAYVRILRFCNMVDLAYRATMVPWYFGEIY